MTFPVSVVVPHKRSRDLFFSRFCLPSIRAAEPAEVIVEPNDGTDPRDAARYRNIGAKKTTQPFLLFVDDDSVLGSDCLAGMLATLDVHPEAAYAYSGFYEITMPGVPTVRPLVSVHEARPFNRTELMHYNYIHTTALIRREVFPGFDEQLARFQDWDLWLTLLKLGHVGNHVADILYHLYNIDVGITAPTVDPTDFMHIVRQKHGI